MSAFNWPHVLNDGHAIIFGGTRRGKSALVQLMARPIARSYREGFTLLDLHGECAQAVFEWLANPHNSDPRRPVHLLKPGSDLVFGLNVLEPHDDSWEAAHDAAMVLISALESWFEASPEQTPRLARIVYVAAHLCARKRLTLLELLELLTLGGNAVRESLLSDFDNQVVRREVEDLHVLALRSPRAFLDVVESARNRFVRLLADRRLARILGQRTGINPRRLMDGRHLTLVDLSSLAGADGAFLGTLITNTFVAAAKRRPALHCARHRLIGDEFESMICTETARLVDQCAKFGLSLICAVQRFGQLRNKGPFIFDALMGNTTVKICFGGLEVESARYIAESFFSGSVDLAEWKRGSERPVAIGQSIRTVRSKTDTKQRSSTSGHSHTSGTTRSRAHVRSWSHTNGTGSGTIQSTADSTSQAYSYYDPDNVSLAMIPPTGFVQGAGAAAVSGASEQQFSSDSYGESEMEGYAETESETHSSSATRGHSRARGTSETYVTDYAWMPSQTYSLEEQLHRLTAEIVNLPRRHCVVKVEGEPPFRMRTADLTPPFQSKTFKQLALPRFQQLVAARSPYLRPAAEIDAEIATRLAALTKPEPPEPEHGAPEPFSIIDDPISFARDFLGRRSRKPPDKKSHDQLPGRAPLGDLGPKHDRFRVIEGPKDDGDNDP
jgi:hypothetical protein